MDKKNAPVFFAPGEWEERIFLGEQESYHCTRVLRMRTGEKAIILNGSGKVFYSELTETGKECVFKIEKIEEKQRPEVTLHLAVAPTKQFERFEWFLEKAVEAGIAAITPLICKRSERKEVKLERLEKIALAALKQSKNEFFPQINPPSPFKAFISTERAGVTKMIANMDSLNPHISNVLKEKQDYVCLVGPEGDFTEEELMMAKEAGFTGITLSNHRLRTETAAVTICVAFNLVNKY